ncbi:hypothetical protein AC579_4010 [Pseudocercospora musae]|uniref:Uncharacterized protein n=1 Tax=Pseudocercospora musae TaxID=113226 RepID=A0A139IHS8_9PEZI|nr:hypothetical protein AC579_4010 [Pseudocercospora musae]
MSLFVQHPHAHWRGWLAALLCCWAAVGDDEYEYEKKSTKAAISPPTLYNRQPTQRDLMSPHASRYHATWNHAAFTEEDRVRPITERPPSIKPLHAGDSSLMRKVSLHGRRKSSTTLLNFHKSAKRTSSKKSPARTSRGQPTNFRRLDCTEKQRRSLKPLQLEPVVLRGDSRAIPSHPITAVRHNASKSFDVDYCRDTAAKRSSYRGSRETPFERCQHMSATAKQDQSPTTMRDETGPARHSSRQLQPTLSTKSSSSSMYSLRRQPLESSTSGTTSSSRTSGERTRLKRKRSNQTNRVPSEDSDELDREILELNTIIEERRAESARPLSPENRHVPAVAPSMTVRARSETLTDIGSAFSRPLRLDTDCPTIAEAVSPTPIKSPVKSRLSRPFTNMPDSNLTTDTVGVVRRPSSRVTGWLTNLLSTSKIPEDTAAAQQPPYTCAPLSTQSRRRAVSEASFCTTIESMSTTSSPSDSKRRHSRSVTGESSSRAMMTPISPPSTACTSEDPERREKRWPTIVDHPGQVGLAL